MIMVSLSSKMSINFPVMTVKRLEPIAKLPINLVKQCKKYRVIFWLSNGF